MLADSRLFVAHKEETVGDDTFSMWIHTDKSEKYILVKKNVTAGVTSWTYFVGEALSQLAFDNAWTNKATPVGGYKEFHEITLP